MTDNLIQNLIQQAKNKRIVFDVLTKQEQQAIEDFANGIQQTSKMEFLVEDVIYCINKSKGCPSCCATLINQRLEMFRNYHGRSGWLLFKDQLNRTDDE